MEKLARKEFSRDARARHLGIQCRPRAFSSLFDVSGRSRFEVASSLFASVDVERLQTQNQETWARFASSHSDATVERELPALLDLRGAPPELIVTDVCTDRHGGDTAIQRVEFTFFLNVAAIVKEYVVAHMLLKTQVEHENDGEPASENRPVVSHAVSTLVNEVRALEAHMTSAVVNPMTQSIFSPDEMRWFVKLFGDYHRERVRVSSQSLLGRATERALDLSYTAGNLVGLVGVAGTWLPLATAVGTMAYELAAAAYLAKIAVEQTKRAVSASRSISADDMQQKITQTARLLNECNAESAECVRAVGRKVARVWSQFTGKNVGQFAYNLQEELYSAKTFMNTLTKLMPYAGALSSAQSSVIAHHLASFLSSPAVAVLTGDTPYAPYAVFSTLFGQILPRTTKNDVLETTRAGAFDPGVQRIVNLNQRIRLGVWDAAMREIERETNVDTPGSELQLTNAGMDGAAFMRTVFRRQFDDFLQSSILPALQAARTRAAAQQKDSSGSKSNSGSKSSAYDELFESDDWATFKLYMNMDVEDDQGDTTLVHLFSIDSPHCRQTCKDGTACISRVDRGYRLCSRHIFPRN